MCGHQAHHGEILLLNEKSEKIAFSKKNFIPFYPEKSQNNFEKTQCFFFKKHITRFTLKNRNKILKKN